MQYFRDHNSGLLVEIAIEQKQSDIVTICPAGGGVISYIPTDQFHKTYQAVDPESLPFTPARVRIDDGKSYPCYLSELRWNGWEVPYVTKETGLQIARDFLDFNSNPVITWNQNKECFVYKDSSQAPDESYAIIPKVITHHGKNIVVFNFGEGWVWSKVNERQNPRSHEKKSCERD